MGSTSEKMTAQQVGAFGEWSVVVELLRRGWVPANINGTVNNSADFDIYAFKDKAKRHVNLRVRACQPGSRAFQFGGFLPNQPVTIAKFDATDFTILVSIGLKREDDEFFIMPSGVVRDAIIARQKAWNSQTKRDGSPRKDTGHWTLRLNSRTNGAEEDGWGPAKKWAQYRENWKILEA